jgi:Ca-activated chloride channel family protein
MLRRPLLLAFLAIVVVANLPRQLFSIPSSASARQQRPPDDRPQIRVEVSLVGVVASVLTKEGRPVAGLTRDSFEIYEEGTKQTIESFEADTQQPIDLALMIDTSASTFHEFAFIREATSRFLKQIVRPVDRVAVYQFSDEVEELSRFSNNVPALQSALALLETGKGTALYDAVVIGADALRRRPSPRRRVILLVTDAGESTSISRFEDARRDALYSEAMLYTVLIRAVKTESGRNTGGEHALISISDVSGGAMLTVDDSSQLHATFDRIDRELRTQYLLGYYPSPRPPARAFRNIEVRVKTPSELCATTESCVIRHRRGYFTSAP